MKFYSCRYNVPFKEMMSKKENEDLLKKILETALKIKVKKILIKNSEQNNGNLFIRRKTLDLLLETNIGLIDIEVNNSIRDYLNYRNMAFISNIYANVTLRGEEYNPLIKVILLNLTYGMNQKEHLKTKNEVEIYQVSNKKNECYIDNFLIYEMNMNKILEFWYSKNVSKIEEFKYLILLGLEKEELLLFSKKNERVKKYMEDLINLNNDPRFMEYMTREEDQRKCYNTDISIAKKEGIKQGKIATAKKMLKENFKPEVISKFTNLTLEEVEKLNE